MTEDNLEYVESLKRENDALREVIAGHEAREERRRAIKDSGMRIARPILGRIVLGDRLFQATVGAWDGWSDWLGRRRSNWPESETRDLGAALVARSTRIVTVGFIIAAIPAIALVIQTFILSKQTRLIGLNNTLIQRQVGLQAFEQTTRLRDLLYQPPLEPQGAAPHERDSQRTASVIWPEPNASVVAQIALFSARQEEGYDALSQLLVDSAGSVSSGALLSLLGRRGHVSMPSDDERINARGAHFRGATFPARSSFGYVDFYQADFAYASLRELHLHSVTAMGANFAFADLSSSRITESLSAAGAIFDGAVLDDFTGPADPQGAVDLQGASFRKAKLTRTSLEYSDLSRSTIEAEESVGFRLNGATLVDATLSGVFQELSARDVNFSRGIATKATFIASDFSGAVLAESNFARATFVSSTLVRTNLDRANFKGVTFTTSAEDAREGDADEGDSPATDASGASFDGTHLEFADLRGIHGLTHQQIDASCLALTRLPDDLDLLNYSRPMSCGNGEMHIGTVHFSFDRTDLAAHAMAALDQLVPFIQSLAEYDPNFRIRIEGHTAGVGTATYNTGLSDRMANSVRAYLSRNGISSERIATFAYGESRPVADNTTAEGRAQNRRVEIVLQPIVP